MRWRPIAITALFALACAWGAACRSGGGNDTTTIITSRSFPQGFLPVLLAGSGSSGDVVFRSDGDLYAVAGTSDVTVVSRANGAVSTFANDVGGASTVLLSITTGVGNDGRLFTGDDAGRIWTINVDGSSPATPFVNTGTNQPITGLTFAPDGFGAFGGSLLAAVGTSGILRITISDLPTVFTLVDPGDRYVDLVFSGTTLFALDATHAEIDTASSDGTVATFQGGFVAPVGIAADTAASELYVADAGVDVLHTVPVAGGTPTQRAAYEFDSDAPSGLAYDGLGAVAFLTSSPLAIRGSNLPRIDLANANFGLTFLGPTVGYGDLEFDRNGAFILAANDGDSGVPGDSTNNFLFSVPRDAAAVTTLSSGVGAPGEQLFGVAVDPVSQVIYFTSSLGNVFRRAADGTVTLLVSASSTAVLGLELAPTGFGAFGGDLIASTADGLVFAIDPQSPNPPVAIPLSQPVSRLSDLVFSTEGALYVVDNGASTSRILRVAPTGTVTDLGAPAGQLGRPDGIEIDEGGNRLLVTSSTSGGDQLLAVDLGTGGVTALANIDLDDGFFPTGVVYDRLGTAVLRQGDNSTALDAVDVTP